MWFYANNLLVKVQTVLRLNKELAFVQSCIIYSKQYFKYYIFTSKFDRTSVKFTYFTYTQHDYKVEGLIQMHRIKTNKVVLQLHVAFLMAEIQSSVGQIIFEKLVLSKKKSTLTDR